MYIAHYSFLDDVLYKFTYLLTQKVKIQCHMFNILYTWHMHAVDNITLLCVDSFVFMCVYFVSFCQLHVCSIIVRWTWWD